nr:DUF456 domain-containing protein [Propionibacterium sp.]
MTPALLAAIAAVLLALVGVAGTIVPVLPGSVTVAAGLLIFALWGGSPYGWIVFAIGLLFVAAGASAQYLITGRTLRRQEIPSRSVLIGIVTGVVGFFVIPVVGLVLGFVAGLFGSEWVRVRDVRRAVETSWIALKSVGFGMLVEFCCAVAATTVLGVAVVQQLL